MRVFLISAAVLLFLTGCIPASKCPPCEKNVRIGNTSIGDSTADVKIKDEDTQAGDIKVKDKDRQRVGDTDIDMDTDVEGSDMRSTNLGSTEVKAKDKGEVNTDVNKEK